MVTRRTTRRYYLLRPDAEGVSRRIYLYVTAVIAKKFGIEVHALQVLSTHMHEVLTDVYGNLPAFLRERNRLLANALKLRHKWPEEVFQRAPASCVELYGAKAIAQKIGYTLANCIKTGVVDDLKQWPGATSQLEDIDGEGISVERPDFYFNPKNPNWPERATLHITMPGVLTQTYGGGALEVLRDCLQGAVALARRGMSRVGNRVAERVARLFSLPVTTRSTSPDAVGGRDPTFAYGGDPSMKAQAMEDRRNFRELYLKAFEALRRGVLTMRFPPGTWRWCQELLPPALHPPSGPTTG